MDPVVNLQNLTEVRLPDRQQADLRLAFQFPSLLASTMGRGVDALLQNPLKKFPLPLASGCAGATGEILVLGFQKPASVVALRVTGSPGQEVSFLAHAHPGGEETLQLKGATVDGDARYEPGTAWSAPAGSVHQPKGVLDNDGVYLAVSYWPLNTTPIVQPGT